MSVPRLEYGPDGYDITNGELNCVPHQFLTSRIWAVYVEFLKVSTIGMTVEHRQNAKNHAILKIDFETAYAPYGRRYLGTRLSMEPDWERESTGSSSSRGGHTPSYKPGRLLMKPVVYPGRSLS